MNSDKGAEPVEVISRENAEHYVWGDSCDGWHLVRDSDLSVGEERGAHARSALGVSQIPFGCCVEIEMVVETFVSESECEL